MYLAAILHGQNEMKAYCVACAVFMELKTAVDNGLVIPKGVTLLV